MIQIIEAVGREWYLRHPEGPRISIGDMALQDGGTFEGHQTHKSGRDADVRYVRNDELEINYSFPLNPNDPIPPGYSQTLTQELVNLFCEYGATFFYFDFNDLDGLVNPPGCTSSDIIKHHHHFHVGYR